MMFSKVIFSRKGLDSGFGKGYSPVDPETGKFILVPIPETDKCGMRVKYEEVHLVPNYLNGIDASNLNELANCLHVNAGYGEYTHLDPWLTECQWLTEDSKHFVGAFGQQGKPQRHLENQKVGP